MLANHHPESSATSARPPIGKVISVGGAEISVGLTATGLTDSTRATVGKFLGVASGGALVVGLITEIHESNGNAAYRTVARLDLLGEIRQDRNGAPRFQRGVARYPVIGEPAMMMTEQDLHLVYAGNCTERSQIGYLQQDASIGAHIDIDSLVSKHFAILGTTGVGKSNGVAIILQRILDVRPNLRVFLIDPHNEYGRCFGDKAQVLNPRNLRLPFWLFNFEETVDVFFGGRPGNEEEVQLLAESIPLAKAMYGQYRGGNERTLAKRRDPRSAGFSADTPVPYRIEDLIALLDERMGKLENRSSRMIYHKLMQRIQTFRNHPRYAFMFENATVGGDTMAEVVSQVFRLPANGKPMTIMQLAGFPAEVVDAVVSVLSRMAFDFGLWSDGTMPLLFVCEEAHRYAPADKAVGFGPTRRALSRIAKEGRKYGVFLGLVTQRPAEIDPNIISQCSTLFVMRLANDRDQALIRSAVSDAAAGLLSFIPSLGTGEAFAFGAGVALPTRLTFTTVPEALRPNAETGSNLRSGLGATCDREAVHAVIERWRSATMSQRQSYDDDPEWGSPVLRDDPPPLAPAPEPQRPSLLRKPIAASHAPQYSSQQPPLTRWR